MIPKKKFGKGTIFTYKFLPILEQFDVRAIQHKTNLLSMFMSIPNAHDFVHILVHVYIHFHVRVHASAHVHVYVYVHCLCLCCMNVDIDIRLDTDMDELTSRDTKWK